MCEEGHDPFGERGTAKADSSQKPEEGGGRKKPNGGVVHNSKGKSGQCDQKAPGGGRRGGGKEKVNKLKDWAVKNFIKCFYTNVDSLLNKRAELLTVIHKDKPDVICLTEILPKTFKHELNLSEIKFEGFTCFSNIQSVAQGARGVVIYVRNEMNAQQVSLDKKYQSVVESVWCEVPLQGKDRLLIGTMYRSPNSSHENNNALNALLKEITLGRSHVLITGDFNYPDINWVDGTSPSNCNNKATVFLDTIRDTFLHQHVVNSTHYRCEQQPTLIDLVFTSEEGMIKDLTHCAPIGKSHHSLLVFQYVCYAKKSNVIKEERFSFSKGDYDGMRAWIKSRNIMSKTMGLNTQDSWDILSHEVQSAIKDFVPVAKGGGGGGKKKPSWLSDKALVKIKEKRQAFHRYMDTRDGLDYLKYARSRNQAKKACKKAVKDHEKEIAKNAKLNPKAFYAYAKSKMNTKEGIADLVDVDGNVAATDADKANVLNKFFCGVFTTEDLNNIPELEKKCVNSDLNDINIETSKILKLLKTLDISKSSGPDGMHPKVLRELSDVIAEPLADVFRKSLKEGTLPHQWKVANVTPLFKKGDKSKAGNYRPVSLTSIPCKIMEKVIRDSVFEHLKDNNLLSDCQHGFVEGRSCVTNLIGVLDDWTKLLDEGKPVDTMYIDFSKAFDSVPHIRLLKKLEAYNIGGTVSDWIQDFLVKRKQRVKVNGALSDWEDVTSGVPQGSVLGPVLFVLFINDLPDVVENLCSIYADDTKIYGSVDTQEDFQSLQSDIDSLVDWADRWQLKFNADKCSTLHLGNKNPGFDFEMRKHGSQEKVVLKSSDAERDLGVIVDSELKFSKHVETQVNKANKILGLIRRSYEFLDCDTMKLLFIALVRPHLEFANCVWSPRFEKDKLLIEGVLRRASKCIPGLKDLEYEDRLKAMKIPSMCYRRLRGDLIEVYKFTHGLYNCDSPLVFNTQSATRGHQYKLAKQYTRTNLRQHFFANRVVDTWNALDANTVNAPTINSFKNRLDNILKDFIYCAKISHPVKPQSPPLPLPSIPTTVQPGLE